MKIYVTKTILFLLIALFLTSCSSYFGQDGRRGVSSSLVDYLYPDGQVPPEHEETTPHLRLPLTVGLAFVPPGQQLSRSLPEAQKTFLLEKVKKNFSELEFVKEIIIIPETYMRSSTGFKGVNQIARLYGLDVVSLVSYDQVAVSAETKSSVLYWTIVGAYFIKGNENKTSTFVDTAVFDVSSNKMLFRAPGVSNTKQSSTLIEVNQSIMDAKQDGFELAMADMSKNLAVELDRFKAKIKEDKSVKITHRDGYGGGGGTQWPFILILGCMAVIRAIKK